MKLAEFVGIAPAAGSATRLGGRVGKELLPLVFTPGSDGELRPRPVIEHTLRAFRSAGLQRAVVVTSPTRPEIMRILGDGAHLGLGLAYVVQESPQGLGQAVLAATRWCGDQPVCLGLPDTVFTPQSAVEAVCAAVRDGADLALGVFPTDRAHELGPVRVGEGGRVEQVLEKPEATDLQNTWGLAAWRPSFSAFLAECLEADRSQAVGAVFDQAIRSGLDCRAVEFPAGRFVDVGTAHGLSQLLLREPGD